jgi:hypothetical protein
MMKKTRAVISAMVGAILMAQPVMADYDTDLWFLSRVIQQEAGYCSEEMMRYVGSVVLNRRNDPRFPDTIEGVITQQGQYSTASQLDSQEPTQEAINVAVDLLENGSVLPGDVIFQANFPQGYATYAILSTSYSMMFFCVG